MQNLLDLMMSDMSVTHTQNGGLAYSTTGDSLVDIFSVAGALRGSEEKLTRMYNRALSSDKELAIKLAFYTRDIRGGLGERDSGRLMMLLLAQREPKIFIANINNVAEYGRWDDLVFVYSATNNESVKSAIISVIDETLSQDLACVESGKSCTLLAKWLPSINTSSSHTRRLAIKIASELGLSKGDYRKALSALRSHLNVVEKNLSSKTFDYIKYSNVPSYAMLKYRNAFQRNDAGRYAEYINALVKGEVKINASNLYPYDLVEKILNGVCHEGEETKALIASAWDSLPNYVDEDDRTIVVADVSGSMDGRPMATSIGLAIYFAERNVGPFHNKFMTFAGNSQVCEVVGKDIFDKVAHLERAHWGTSTNFQSIFTALLNTATKYKCSPEDMPKRIVIISDMEFNNCVNEANGELEQSLEMIDRLYDEAGYKRPDIVFWNVDSKTDVVHAKADDEAVQLVSGQSPSVFKAFVSGESLTPRMMVEQCLNDSRYDAIVTKVK